MNELAWFRSWYEPLLNRFTSVLENLVLPAARSTKVAQLFQGTSVAVEEWRTRGDRCNSFEFNSSIRTRLCGILFGALGGRRSKKARRVNLLGPIVFSPRR